MPKSIRQVPEVCSSEPVILIYSQLTCILYPSRPWEPAPHIVWGAWVCTLSLSDIWPSTLDKACGFN